MSHSCCATYISTPLALTLTPPFHNNNNDSVLLSRLDKQGLVARLKRSLAAMALGTGADSNLLSFLSGTPSHPFPPLPPALPTHSYYNTPSHTNLMLSNTPYQHTPSATRSQATRTTTATLSPTLRRRCNNNYETHQPSLCSPWLIEHTLSISLP